VTPDGDFLVNGPEVTFIPRVRTVAGVSTFGFLRNENYIISLAGGNTAAQGVRSISGDTLTRVFTCTVRASLGILDEDQQPPRAELVAPANRNEVPLDPTIVLRFSELIDTTPLQAPLSATSPIRVTLRPIVSPQVCNTENEGIVLEGLPQLSTEVVGGHDVTVVTFRPSVQLPGSACLTVAVGSELRDLSGRQAEANSWELFTILGAAQQIAINEAFANASGQDEQVSGGLWNDGARPGLIGGDGRHGSFSPTFGASVGGGVFVWDVSVVGGINIPASNTPSGTAFQVTDGRFFFTDFVVPSSTIVRFKGAVPPQIFVRGKVEVRGIIECSADDMPGTLQVSGPLAGQRLTNFNARGAAAPSVSIPGQLGGEGGPGAGRGGAGGSECIGAALPANSGVAGQAVVPIAGHAYAGLATGTGGAGSPLAPPNGSAGAIAPFITGAFTSVNFRDEFSRGGAGGRYITAGSQPGTPTIPGTGGQPVPSAAPAAGVAFPLLPFPVTPPPGYQSLTHYLVGGSGGGGGGSHTFATQVITGVTTETFSAGHGGSGGGGAIAIRAGNVISMIGSGEIRARGGRGVVITGDNPGTITADVEWGASSPGGGGSGGSVLLQSARSITVQGLLDASGGPGSRTTNVNAGALAPTQLNVTAQAGAGSNGFYRLETVNGVTWNGLAACVPTFDPQVHTGSLNDRDGASGDVSRWRATGQLFAPTWLGYELDVDTDGDTIVDITYTDSGAPGTQLANDPLGPVTVRFQGATLQQSGTEPVEGTVRPWRDRVLGTPSTLGITNDNANGIRFELNYNRAAFPNQVIRALRIRATT
jgi:hypothetical protein